MKLSDFVTMYDNKPPCGDEPIFQGYIQIIGGISYGEIE